MHEGTDSVKESKLDVLQSQLDKFKMKDGEGVTEMYSRLALITNEIAGYPDQVGGHKPCVPVVVVVMVPCPHLGPFMFCHDGGR